MCGIAGVKWGRSFDKKDVEAMVEALVHRGPDSSGYFATPGYVVGMRRLSINDLESGSQPLYSEDQDVVMIYNGEIYNSPELRRQLESKGVRFKTRSDGEVIPHLYKIYGEKVFEKLDGMYAAAIWIQSEQKLILARDIPGEKPLYYSELKDGGVAFSSEVRSLMKFPEISQELDLQSLWDFPSFLWIPEPRTTYRAVKMLPRSHMLIMDAQGLRLKPFENTFAAPASSQSSIEEKIEQTRTLVTEAVHSRLLSDVPVGAFLSGGLDSSIVCFLAKQKLDRLDTFTVGFEQGHDPYHGLSDESQEAEAFAMKLGTCHHTLRVEAKDFQNIFDDFVHFSDQPFGVSSGFGVMAISRLARDLGIKVLVTGDGADEAFGGYSWYPQLPQALGAGTALSPDVSMQHVGLSIEERMTALRSQTPTKRAWAWHYYASESDKKQLFSNDAFSQMSASWNIFSGFKTEKEQWSDLDYIEHDRRFYFPFEMLRKADRMTMAYSVEGRVPFAAPALQNFVKGLKYSDMIQGTTLKWVLRQAFKDVLPDEIVNRPKHGFNVPVDRWLKGMWKTLLEETFAKGSALDKTGLLAPNTLPVALKMSEDATRLNGHTLLCFIVLNKWLENN